jgi:hypothetical protein
VLSEFTGFFTEGLFRPESNCLSFPVGEISLAADQVGRLQRDRCLLARLSKSARDSQDGAFIAPNDIKEWAAFLGEAAGADANGTGTQRRSGVPPLSPEKAKRQDAASTSQTALNLAPFRTDFRSAAARFPEDSGRLNQLPRRLQRLFRRFSRHTHVEAGGEWPHASGWTTEEERREFAGFALAHEQRNKQQQLHRIFGASNNKPQ